MTSTAEQAITVGARGATRDRPRSGAEGSSPGEIERTPEVGRGRTVALWAVQILLAALFAFAGISKLLALQPEVVQGFAQIGLGQWFRYLTGSLELAGAIGLLIPRLSGLAALALAGVMVGAIIAHVLVLPPAAMAVVPATIGTVLVLIARARRSQIRALLPGS